MNNVYVFMNNVYLFMNNVYLMCLLVYSVFSVFYPFFSHSYYIQTCCDLSFFSSLLFSDRFSPSIQSAWGTLSSRVSLTTPLLKSLSHTGVRPRPPFSDWLEQIAT